MTDQNEEFIILDEDLLNIKSVELMRLKTYKKYGLGYFETIIEKIKIDGKCSVNKAEFELKLNTAQ